MLSRRFQVIKIEEPDEEKALLMMRAIAPLFEAHHKVSVTDEALVDSVRLSMRYVSGRARSLRACKSTGSRNWSWFGKSGICADRFAAARHKGRLMNRPHAH